MTVLYGADEQVADWVFERIDVETPPFNAALGFMIDEQPVAGVVYANYSGCNIELHCAADSPRWCTRENLRHLFGYPFNQLGCLRVTAMTAKRNKRCRKLLEGLGFSLEGAHPKAYGGEDMVSYGMLREKCRWIDDGQERRRGRLSSSGTGSVPDGRGSGAMEHPDSARGREAQPV